MRGGDALRFSIPSDLLRYQLASINEELMLIDKKTNHTCPSIEIEQNVCTFLVKMNKPCYRSPRAQDAHPHSLEILPSIEVVELFQEIFFQRFRELFN